MMLPLCAALVISQGSPDADRLSAWGAETLRAIRRSYYLPEKLLYAEQVEPGKPAHQVAFNWSVGVLLSALNAGAKADPEFIPWLKEFANAIHIYWNEEPPVAGFDVLPVPKPTERFYDDNAWMVMALAETAETLKDPKFLDWADKALQFVLSGEDDKLGGGVYWKEQDRTHKNTCSSGPAAAACMAVFHQTKSSRLLADAIRLYAWTKHTLQDPQDHLFWDSISLQGHIEKSKWSYNTALMIRTAADLYSVTHNPAYLKDLKEMQSASAKRWLNGSLHDEGRFGHLLLESWTWQRRLVPLTNPNQKQDDERAFVAPLSFVHDRARNALGFYGKRFDSPPGEDQKSFELIDQASAARAYFEAARALGHH